MAVGLATPPGGQVWPQQRAAQYQSGCLCLLDNAAVSGTPQAGAWEQQLQLMHDEAACDREVPPNAEEKLQGVGPTDGSDPLVAEGEGGLTFFRGVGIG